MHDKDPKKIFLTLASLIFVGITTTMATSAGLLLPLGALAIGITVGLILGIYLA